MENNQQPKFQWHFIEWISTIAVFITCFAYLSYKIEKQADRTDRLYEMFIDLLKDWTK